MKPRRALGALLGIGIVTTAAAPAHAFSGIADAYIYSLVITVLPDAAFATYGIVVAGKGELPSAGLSIAEIAVTAPQTVFYTTVYAAYQGKDDDQEPLPSFFLIPSAATSILTTHGIWSTATSNVRPGVLAGASIAVGIDAVLTTGVLASTFNGRLSGREIGVATALLTAPQIAVASTLAATSPGPSRAGWIGLSAWSGALFVHGLASAIHGHGDDPPPRAPFPSILRAPRPAPSSRRPLLGPSSIHVGPVVVSDGVASAPGIGVSGVLF
jgi:hypothetical protein